MRSPLFANLVKNKRVLLRLDLNVPIQHKKILDNTKIIESLQTISYIQKQKPKMLTIISHLGRPNGRYNKDLTMEPIVNELSNLLNCEINYGPIINPNNSIYFLENLRFHKGEYENDKKFANRLSSFCDIYINDAFAVSHRKHASVSSIYNFFPKENVFNGFIIEKEKKILDGIINHNLKPYIVIMGGNKLKDKINSIEGFMATADKILIGGALSFCFLRAKGFDIGNSPCNDSDVIIAKKLLDNDIGNKLVLRADNIVSGENPKYCFATSDENIPHDLQAFDIGPKTIKLFYKYLKSAKVIFWNGPVGVSEIAEYSRGTIELIQILCHTNKEVLVIGGGDTRKIMNSTNYPMNNIQFVTGGGASLEYLTKGTLPGLI